MARTKQMAQKGTSGSKGAATPQGGKLQMTEEQKQVKAKLEANVKKYTKEEREANGTVNRTVGIIREATRELAERQDEASSILAAASKEKKKEEKDRLAESGRKKSAMAAKAAQDLEELQKTEEQQKKELKAAKSRLTKANNKLQEWLEDWQQQVDDHEAAKKRKAKLAMARKRATKNTPSQSSTPRKRHYHPGTRALMEIKKYQKTTELFI